MSSLHPLQRGKHAYSEKRYDDAVQYLSEALATSKVHTDTVTTILDLRCQAYVKLGKHELALQDAKHMVLVGQRKQPEGYLRCSQVERTFGNYPSAIKWLDHGIKKVPLHRHVFEGHIEKVQALLEQHNADKKRQDPINAAPLEVIQHILSYLNYREVVCLLRVSKSWKHLVSSMKPLTTTVDFTGTLKKVSSQACTAAFRRLCKEPQKIVLVSLSSAASKVAEVWLAKPFHIETLRVLQIAETDIELNMTSLKRLLKIESLHIGRGQNLNFTEFLQLVECCQTIKDAGFDGEVWSYFPSFHGSLQEHLQNLYIRNHSRSVMAPTLDFRTYPNLESLTISGVDFPTSVLDLSSHHHLLKLHLDLIIGPTLKLRLPECLEDLSIVEQVRNPPSLVNFVEPLNVHNLHTLTLKGWSILSMLTGLRNSDPPRLDRVALHHLPGMSVSDISRQDKGMFRTATHVSLISEQLSDDESEDFTMLFPKVENLTLESAPRITGVFLSNLVTKPHCRLKEVVLRHCNRVSPDTCQWLKSKGISSRLVNNTSDIKGGQRVRGDW